MYARGIRGLGRVADRKIAPFWLAPSPGLSYTHLSISAVFQDGDRRLELVCHDGSRCGGRVFSMDGDFLWVT